MKMRAIDSTWHGHSDLLSFMSWTHNQPCAFRMYSTERLSTRYLQITQSAHTTDFRISAVSWSQELAPQAALKTSSRSRLLVPMTSRSSPSRHGRFTAVTSRLWSCSPLVPTSLNSPTWGKKIKLHRSKSPSSTYRCFNTHHSILPSW